MTTGLTVSDRSLSDLPNITVSLADALRRAGLNSPEALRLAGAEAAWNLLRLAGGNAPMHGLLALEGAIQGVKWQDLAPSRRYELVRFAASWLH